VLLIFDPLNLMVNKWFVKNSRLSIDAHRGGPGERGRRRGAPHVPPQKTLKNCNIKMQENTKIEDPLLDFFTTPCTPSKEFENDCASMRLSRGWGLKPRPLSHESSAFTTRPRLEAG
jgi:hypothetical protein